LAQSGVEQGEAQQFKRWATQALADDDRDIVDTNSRANTLAQVGRGQALLGEIGMALELGERAVALCDRIAVRYDALVRARHAWLLFELGRRDLALKTLQPLLARDTLPALDLANLETLRLLCGEPMDGQAVLTHLLAIDDFPNRVRLLCLLQPALAPESVLPLLALHAMQARDFGAHGLWLALQARRVAALKAAGQVGEAVDQAQAVWRRLESGRLPAELYPRVAASLVLALRERQPDLAETIALSATSWMNRAAVTLPPEWRDNFLSRTPLLHALTLRPHAGFLV
jgi:tetratricopeptide (TPR) repeat protein